MTTESPNSRDDGMVRLAMYREVQRAIPGLYTIYRLAAAVIGSQPFATPQEVFRALWYRGCIAGPTSR